MINFLLFLLLIHYLNLIIFKPKNNVLNCGIIAWAGKNPKNFNKLKFDILGIYNDSRGGDSCGITVDGEIFHGLLQNKEYKNFIVNKTLNLPEKYPTVIGHTRKSSFGGITSDNAHPFGFGEHNEGYKMIGVHNGTLLNHHELAKMFNLEVSIYDEHNKFIRTKIDSEILLESIYKSNNFEVLSQYNGGAAIVFTDTSEPNVIYAFKGASSWDKNSIVTSEERPLYYYVENKNSLYISSLAEPLVAIGGIVEESVFEFEENYVYKIKDGDISKAIKFIINRDNCYQKASYNNFSTDRGNNSAFGGQAQHTINYSKKENVSTKKKEISAVENIKDDLVIRYGKHGCPIYMKSLRYYRNGHLLTGIYTYVKDYGFVKLAYNAADVNTSLEDLIGKTFDLDAGDFISDQRLSTYWEMTNHWETLIVPFPKNSNRYPNALYFYNGILLETKLDYVNIVANPNLFTTVTYLSHMSKHPIVDLELSNAEIIKNGTAFTGKISPLCSGRIYDIENGKLVSIALLSEENTDFRFPSTCKLPLNITDESDNETFNKIILEHIENKKKIEDFLDEDPPITEIKTSEEISKKVSEVMMPIYSSCQAVEKKLEEYKDDEYVQEMIDVTKEFVMCVDTIVSKKEEINI